MGESETQEFFYLSLCSPVTVVEQHGAVMGYKVKRYLNSTEGGCDLCGETQSSSVSFPSTLPLHSLSRGPGVDEGRMNRGEDEV